MLNRYKNMVVLSAKSAEDLKEQIKSLSMLFDIQAMYASGGRHYAYIIPDRPVKLVKRKPVKHKSIESMNEKINKE